MKDQSQAVLYDIPGPRARRITLISSLVAAVVVLVGAYFLIYLPLERNDQFTAEKWGPLVDPSNEVFSQVWDRIGFGARMTLTAAVLAILLSLLLGTLLAVSRLVLRGVRTRRFPDYPAPIGLALRINAAVANTTNRALIELFRGLPVVITIFFVSKLGPSIGLDLEPLWYLVVGLTIYNMVVIGEIIRSGMDGLPPGQAEAASALGLSRFQTIRMILLPQAFKVMLPALISQLVVVLKDTSLGFLIAYEELLNIGKQIIGNLGNPIQVYFVIGVLFITVNYGLSKLAGYVQRRLARGRTTRQLVAEAPDLTDPGAGAPIL
ncbi:amino acid ABC transporter permease [Longispora sp. K20-0274]|uniref:amino acid ABC transporter permease n=1 Tax=Longispora sp. K20-0274 TaxID=3088255 RepID=UPI00399C076E